MKKLICLMLVFSIFCVGCSTAVRIVTDPPEAKVYLNQQTVGNTPINTDLTNLVWEDFNIRIEKPGYKTLSGKLQKEFKVGAFIGGLFIWPLLLWCYGPKDYQVFELEPVK
jgi:hypothetical protein